MIKNIRASVTFPISGEVLNVDFSPPLGATAVVGPNGSGKTFAGSEATRWLLFGKAALRGEADDYKTLDGKGEFTIAGDDYTIERTPKKEQITDATGAVLAVGAKAVTAKVEELFGYGLAVFDICNASVQGDAAAFGKMRPAERKRMIDRVCGVTSVEAVEKECRDKARALRAKAEALTTTLVAPVAPVKPEGYRTSDDVRLERDTVREMRATADAITATMRPAHEPDKPTSTLPAPATLEATQVEEEAHRINSAERRRLQSILSECMAYDPVGYTEEQLLAAEQRNIIAEEIERRGPKPTMSLKALRELEKEWVNYNYARRQSDEHASCPKCKHRFRIGGELPPAPSVADAVVRTEMLAHNRWILPQPAMPDGPDLTPKDITHARNARASKERHDRAAEMLDAVPITTSVADKITAMMQAVADWRAYDAAMEKAKAQIARNVEAEQNLRKLGELPALDAADKLTEEWHAALAYEREVQLADNARKLFEDRSAEIATSNAMAAAFGEGAKSLSEARTELKTVLTPLLSATASSLIFDMTNGALKAIAVDEDMEITVDGRRIETLSGAGVTVANLALRIGLGQVLVKGTFPVFLGDEMDSDADATRREATLAAMRGLRKQLKQIILITHREVEDVDMVLNMGG